MSRRSLFPREHGAYLQLAIPLIAAWCSERPGAASLLIGFAACLAFLAHEPLLVLLGVRGARMRHHEGRRARAWFGVLAGAAAIAGAIGLVLAPRATLPFAAAATLLGAVLVMLARRRAEHTLAGELVAAAALTGASAIVRISAGAAQHVALAWWLGWATGFGATVVAVHRVIARHKHPASLVDHVLGVAGLAASVALLATARAHLTCLLAAPLVVAATAIILAPPRANRLRAVGVAISIVAAVAAIAATFAVS